MGETRDKSDKLPFMPEYWPMPQVEISKSDKFNAARLGNEPLSDRLEIGFRILSDEWFYQDD